MRAVVPEDWNTAEAGEVRDDIILEIKQAGSRRNALMEVLPRFLHWARQEGWNEDKVNRWRAWLTVRINQHYNMTTPGRKSRARSVKP